MKRRRAPAPIVMKTLLFVLDDDEVECVVVGVSVVVLPEETPLDANLKMFIAIWQCFTVLTRKMEVSVAAVEWELLYYRRSVGNKQVKLDYAHYSADTAGCDDVVIFHSY